MDDTSNTGEVNHSDAHATSSEETCNFLSLPQEIRRMVYEFIVFNRNIAYKARLKTLTRLLRASEQIYWDTSPYLYADESVYLITTFVGTEFDVPSHGMQIKDYDSFDLSHIRCLQLDLRKAPGACAQDYLSWINTHVRHCPALRALYIRAGFKIDKVLHQVLLGLLTTSRQRPLRIGFKVIATCRNRSAGRDRWPRDLSEDKIEATYKNTCNEIVQHDALENITVMLDVKYSDWLALEDCRLGKWGFARSCSHYPLKMSFLYMALDWEEMIEEDDSNDRLSQSSSANH